MRGGYSKKLENGITGGPKPEGLHVFKVMVEGTTMLQAPDVQKRIEEAVRGMVFVKSVKVSPR